METRALWCVILTWADKDGTGAFPTQETLSHVCGMSEQWVKKQIKILNERGFIRITKEKRNGARYFHNVYALKTRSTERHPCGYPARPLTKSLYQNSDSLAVESEAILRVVKYEEGVDETPEKYRVV